MIDDRMFIYAEGEYLIVHFEPGYANHQNRVIAGTAYWSRGPERDDSPTWIYMHKDGDVGDDITELNPDACVAFSFQFQWRGVWEGRIYFPNDKEYWSDQLTVMAEAWEAIESWAKETIRKNNPDYKYFDK